MHANPLLLAFASPLTHHGVAFNYQSFGARAYAPLANGLPLRIMPLGASITYGFRSTDGNGYRSSLRSQLADAGNPVNMVGSRQHGTMRDNDVEGWSGFVIDQVYAKANASVPKFKPNVILVNAGTNDAAQNLNVSTAGDRMERMLLSLYEMSPRATIVLSSLLVNADPRTEENVQLINEQYNLLAQKLRDQGHPLVFTEMHGTDGLNVGELVDGTHPTDIGYKKMANLWYEALVRASNEGFIQRAENVTGLPDDGAGAAGVAS